MIPEPVRGAIERDHDGSVEETVEHRCAGANTHEESLNLEILVRSVILLVVIGVRYDKGRHPQDLGSDVPDLAPSLLSGLPTTCFRRRELGGITEHETPDPVNHAPDLLRFVFLVVTVGRLIPEREKALHRAVFDLVVSAGDFELVTDCGRGSAFRPTFRVRCGCRNAVLDSERTKMLFECAARNYRGGIFVFGFEKMRGLL